MSVLSDCKITYHPESEFVAFIVDKLERWLFFITFQGPLSIVNHRIIFNRVCILTRLSHFSRLSLRRVNWVILHPADTQEDFQTRCSVFSTCLRKNSYDNLWYDSRRICSFALMYVHSRVRWYVPLQDWQFCQMSCSESCLQVFFHSRQYVRNILDVGH